MNNEKKNEMIYGFYFETEMARCERQIKRLWIALIISFILFFIANVIWIYEWTRYDYSSSEVYVDASDGDANYIGRDGSITNAENYSEETPEN